MPNLLYRRKRTPPPLPALREELRDVSVDLRAAFDRFHRADDHALTEAAVFEINALQARYGAILRKIKLLHQVPL